MARVGRRAVLADWCPRGNSGTLGTLRERRHRRLARRLVASARAYVGFVRANVAEYDIAEVSSLARQVRDPSVKNVRVAVLRASD
jgi:hypothetical protein